MGLQAKITHPVDDSAKYTQHQIHMDFCTVEVRQMPSCTGCLQAKQQTSKPLMQDKALLASSAVY